MKTRNIYNSKGELINSYIEVPPISIIKAIEDALEDRLDSLKEQQAMRSTNKATNFMFKQKLDNAESALSCIKGLYHA